MRALEQKDDESLYWAWEEEGFEWLVLDDQEQIVIHNTTEYRARLIAQRLSD